MSKERLEEIIQDLPYSTRHAKEVRELADYAREKAERVRGLEKKSEKERRVRKYLRNKNKLYLTAIRKAERLTDYEANVILREALEESK